MLITDIKKIDEKRFCLYLDYEPFGPVYLSDIRKLKLAVGEEAEPEKLQAFRKDVFYKRAMNKAVASIQYSEKCEADIRQKLKDLYYDDAIIDATLHRLKEYGYVDDSRYASVYIRSHINRKSRKEIGCFLSSKGIADDMIQEAFEENQLPEEKDVICNLISKRCALTELDRKKEKVTAYLIRKGYPYRLVVSCIQEMLSQ